MPWRAGIAHRVAGSWYGQGGHTGTERYALDWNLWYEPTLAVRAGTVTVALRGVRDPGGKTCKRQSGFGNYVVIAHPDGARSLYAHLSRVSVRVGQRVRQGTVLGISGNSGWSCGPHLHFRMTRGGTPIKPEPMGGFRTFPNNKGRLYTSRNILNGPLPPATPVPPEPSPKPAPRPKPRPAPRRSPHLVPITPLLVGAPTYTARETVSFGFRAKNTGDAAQTVAVFGVKLWTPDGEEFILPCINGTNRILMPGAVFGCGIKQPLEDEGTYAARAGWLDPQGNWHSRLFPPTKTFEMHRPRLTVDAPQHVEMAPSPVQGATATFTYTVHNPAAIALKVHSFYVRVWKPGGSSTSLPCTDGWDVTLLPLQAFACTATMALDRAGTYTFRSNWQDDQERFHNDEIGVRETFSVAEPPRATLTVHVEGYGKVSYSGTSCTSDCTKSYPIGAQVTLTASKRRSGGAFESWTGACEGSEPTCTLTIQADTTVGATFKQLSG